jgi:hypothetical protein
MNRTERLQEVLRLEGIASAAMARSAEHRQALAVAARAELEREGAAPTWRVTDIGAITLPVSKEEPFVAAPDLFLAYCRERYPDAVERIEQVRPSFQEALFRMAILEEGDVVDGGSGEVVPGVAIRPGGVPRSLSIRPTPEAKAVYAAAGAQLLDTLLAPPAEPVGHLEPSEVHA